MNTFRLKRVDFAFDISMGEVKKISSSKWTVEQSEYLAIFTAFDRSNRQISSHDK
jgi:hypothetical protein